MKAPSHVKTGFIDSASDLQAISFSELLLKRRSIRKYLDKPVDLDLLKRIIQESVYAPSAGNEQPWKFIIIQNSLVLQEISKVCKKTLLARIAADPYDYAKKYQQMLSKESFNIFYNAPCLVLIIGESQVKNVVFDCTLAASYFMMSAAEKGLGTCWINFAKVLTNPMLHEKIGLPEDHTIVAPIIIGYPAVEPSPSKRKAPHIINIIK